MVKQSPVSSLVQSFAFMDDVQWRGIINFSEYREDFVSQVWCTRCLGTRYILTKNMCSEQLGMKEVLSEGKIGNCLYEGGYKTCQSLVLDWVHAKATIVMWTVDNLLFWLCKHVLV